MSRSGLLKPAVFGTFDGLTAVLGILLCLRGHPDWVLPSALGLAVAEGVGMAAGEWLSSESDVGLAASGVIGLATAGGSLAPALPFSLFSLPWAYVASGIVLAALGVGIAAVRARDRGWLRALAETFGVLVAALAAVGVCVAVTPGGSA